jgi:hypothetical protein
MGYNNDFNRDYPEFSRIRSHIERANAQRSVVIGYAIAEAIIATSAFIGRCSSAIFGGAARRKAGEPVTDR